MTKAAALLLAGSLALAACASDEDTGSSGGGESASETIKVGLAYDTGGRGDRSFNDSAYAGVEAAVEELGGDPKEDIQEVSPNDDGSDRAELLSNLAEQGYNPVIAVGFAYDETLGEVAKQFPDTTFAQVDGSVDFPEFKGDNVTGLLFAEHEGSFLAGVAAALKTSTKTVGFVGGVDTQLIQKFQAGYEAGVKAANPEVQVISQYITPDGDFSGFSDPAKGKIVAQGMFEAGADIVYHAAGGSGQGVFEAAAAANGRAIGVDSDQYNTVGDPALQAVIMTSMLKRVDNAVAAFIADFAEGKVEGGSDVINDLSTEGVGLSTTGGFIDDIQEDIDSFRQQIIDGEIEVPTTPTS
ncbi:MAG: BMP family ABC transporter substrate-binding protein [Blastococcus sp.]